MRRPRASALHLVGVALISGCSHASPADDAEPHRETVHAASCVSTSDLAPEAQAHIRSLVSALESDAKLNRGCATITVLLAAELDRYGADGWALAEAAAGDPETVRRARVWFPPPVEPRDLR